MKHDDVIKWKHFPRYWPFVRAIHRSPVNSPHKGQWRETSMIPLMCAWIIGWVNNGEAGDFRRHRTHYGVTVMNLEGIAFFIPMPILPNMALHMMRSSNGNIFRVIGHLCGEFTRHRWILRTKASNAERWSFLWSAPWIKGWANNRKAGDLRRHRAHYDVNVMKAIDINN